ncbi:DUF2330 domain-containing protein [Candidatus Oscillochloris fontis]|uniref:DUF2330 domain-containing protein n=1 Tax=Candidatus Oscillochloris fontis TaxID=2496868 RepID=UPI00101CBB9D|nr:DUF2330 domain-containing protein [Candidatus Oscillochloris fontis]
MLRTLPLLILLTTLLLTTTSTRAASMPLGAEISYERALLIASGDQQQLILTIDVHAASPNAALVIPVPGVPSVDQPHELAQLFPYLSDATQPDLDQQNRYVWRVRTTPTPTPPNVDLLGRQQLGDLVITSLSSSDAPALQVWLGENQYELPAAAEPLLAEYVAEGWYFVVVGLANAASGGATPPIRISYQAEEVVYPMRLAAPPMGLDLYVLSEHRYEATGLTPIFAGPVENLTPPPDAGVADLLTAAPYLTRLHTSAVDSALLGSDLQLERAADDSPYRATFVQAEMISFADRYGVLMVLLCLAAFSPISFVLALSIRRRIRAIVPPPEED